ncbi:MAG: hypothetical protein OEL84_00670 [Nitrosopumilus sp.]|nr:hypothetical protein [Nitrosopumilus sp.]
MRDDIESLFTMSVFDSASKLEPLDGMQELTSWYKKIAQDDNILEKILEKIVNETMKYLPQQYASLCVENIKINSKNKKQNVKFDINFQLKPIRCYVEFMISVNKVRKKAGRIVFETNSSCTIKDLEIFSKKEKDLRICLGIISGTIQISIIEIPFIKIDEPIEICTKEIEVDLSEYNVDAN